MRKAITIGLVVLLLISVGFNIILYKVADEEITKLQNQVEEFNSTFGGVQIENNSIVVSIDYYNKKPVIIKHTLIHEKVIEIEPGTIRYSCFNYVVKDTRLHIEAKKLDNTPVNFYLFDYEKYMRGDASAVIFGGGFSRDNQTYYLERFSAMEVGRTYCIGFSVPTKIYTTSGEKDVATNAKVWVKAEITAYADIYPEEIMKKD